MDYIFDLPKSKMNNTTILAVVDKLCKRAHFISLKSIHAAKDTAEEFYKEVYKHRGLPRRIISGRHSRFTSNYWTELMKKLKVKLNLSTAFHPQTDGQSERRFRTIEEMLRCFISHTQRDWDGHLPGLEFAYNNHTNESTKQRPFFLDYGQNLFSLSDILHSDLSESRNESANTFKEDMQTANRLAQEAIREANAANSDNANKH